MGLKHETVEESFAVSPDLLEYWYPGQEWLFVQKEGYIPFRPTHMIELVFDAKLLASDLVCLNPNSNMTSDNEDLVFAFCPQKKDESLIPAYVYDTAKNLWWNFVNEEPEYKAAKLYVQKTKWVEDNSEIGWVYFIQEDEEGPVKIGWSRDVKARLINLQTANPSPLNLRCAVPGHLSEEKRLHDHFSEDRIQGEWFRFSKRVKSFMEKTNNPFI